MEELQNIPTKRKLMIPEAIPTRKNNTDLQSLYTQLIDKTEKVSNKSNRWFKPRQGNAQINNKTTQNKHPQRFSTVRILNNVI